MTVTALQLALYAGAIGFLWLTPGPVFVAITARALSGGFRAAWPLALGVMIGDFVWPMVAIFGLSAILAQVSGLMVWLRWVAALMFLAMGVGLFLHAGRPVTTDSRLTRPGLSAGFSAGVAAILGNPKAILFYMGVLPGFFDLGHVTAPDIAAILAISMTIPFLGNCLTALLVSLARARITAPGMLRKINLVAGGLLIVVGVLIALV